MISILLRVPWAAYRVRCRGQHQAVGARVKDHHDQGIPAVIKLTRQVASMKSARPRQTTVAYAELAT